MPGLSKDTLSEDNSILNELLSKAHIRGYLITDDLVAAFPEPEDDLSQLEKIFTQLVSEGIEVYADAEEARKERKIEAIRKETLYNAQELTIPETRIKIGYLSPSFGILEKLLAGGINIDTLHWRDFEELVAELLEKDGYTVDLGPGSKDGGVDIIAVKDLGEIGLFKSVWQAKKKEQGNKVGLSIIRELADTRNEYKASKAMVVTTTYLTKGALQRVQRDQYILGKVDRDDLMFWTERILRGSKY